VYGHFQKNNFFLLLKSKQAASYNKMNIDPNNNSTANNAFVDPSKNPHNSNYLNINASVNREFTHDHIKKIADWLTERTSIRPRIAIVCGSGLGGIAERLDGKQVFPYSEIPNFPQSTGELLTEVYANSNRNATNLILYTNRMKYQIK
jgi:hypothetical protein